MNLDSAAQLVTALSHYRLLSPSRLQELSCRPPTQEAQSLALELLERGWLTAYQANQLLQGRGEDLLLGSYVLLERLGQGGMGQVFKARHQKLDRLVALKVIHTNWLDSPEAVERFYREIRAAALLNHPNIVLAYDADQIGNRHFFTMEYVQGTDLARLVKEKGPRGTPRAASGPQTRRTSGTYRIHFPPASANAVSLAMISSAWFHANSRA